MTTAHASTVVLDMQHVAKTFGRRRVLDVDRLTVRSGEIHALLGQNGSGKSTLIKILAGYHPCDPDDQTVVAVLGTKLGSSSAESRREAGLRFVHQDLGLVADMSVLDNVFLGRRYPTSWLTIRRGDARDGARAALARAGVPDLPLDVPVGSLAPSERTGVAIARALAGDDHDLPALLVLDEPTATLPAPEVDRLLSTLTSVAQTGVAILYVTHHLDEVFAIADRVSVLRDGVMVASQDLTSLTRNDVVHHLVGAELEALHREVQADGSPAALEPVLVVDDLVGARLDHVSFVVAPGEVVGFHGVTGSGRDSVMGTVFGRLRRESGTVRVGGTELPPMRPDRAIDAGLGYVPSDRKLHGGVMSLTAAENVSLPSLSSLWRRGRIDERREAREVAEWFDRLDVRPADGARLPLENFSGGNQQKVVLAKWLRRSPAVLLLDEPTQGVDIGAKAVIHRTILDFTHADLAVLIASSDVEELAALCTTVHIMQAGRVVDTVTGPDVTERELNRRLNVAGQHADLSEGTLL